MRPIRNVESCPRVMSGRMVAVDVSATRVHVVNQAANFVGLIRFRGYLDK
jgi:hypothetical protein